MITLLRILGILAVFGVLVLAPVATPGAHASEPAVDEAADAGESTGDDAVAEPPQKKRVGQVLGGILLAIVMVAGVGCMIAVLGVIFPGPALRADEALLRLGTGRLLLTGLLPLVGAGLLGAAAEASGVQALQVAWGILVGLPVLVLVIVGALAAVPHLGGAVLRKGERALLWKSVTGALVLGFGLGAVGGVSREVGVLLALIVTGWFLGAGLGVLFRPRTTKPSALDEGVVDGE